MWSSARASAVLGSPNLPLRMLLSGLVRVEEGCTAVVSPSGRLGDPLVGHIVGSSLQVRRAGGRGGFNSFIRELAVQAFEVLG